MLYLKDLHIHYKQNSPSLKHPITNNIKQITINSSYTNAWRNFFNDTLSNSMPNFSIDDTIYSDGINITFLDTDEAGTPELSLNVIEIEIQILPGWVR